MLCPRLAYRGLFPQHRVLTGVREPRSRLISFWLSWRTRNLYHLGTRAHSLRVYVGLLVCVCVFLVDPAVAAQTGNLEMRMLLCKHRLIPVRTSFRRQPSADARDRRTSLSEVSEQLARLRVPALAANHYSRQPIS